MKRSYPPLSDVPVWQHGNHFTCETATSRFAADPLRQISSNEITLTHLIKEGRSQEIIPPIDSRILCTYFTNVPIPTWQAFRTESNSASGKEHNETHVAAFERGRAGWAGVRERGQRPGWRAQARNP